MTDALAAIRARRSCRTFGATAPAPAVCAALGRLAAAREAGPFGTPLRFQLVDGAPGTYGIVRGAARYLAGSVDAEALAGSPMALEDYGWAMEELVLEATGLGLGTCWMAGTFRRAEFAGAMRLADDDIVPAVVPLGVPAPAASVPDAILHLLAGSRRRRPWRRLFFREAVSRGGAPVFSPLEPGEAGAWQPCLEAVRLAPSARNAQPWRIVMVGPGDQFRLLVAGPVGERSARRLDAGIAMCHFALAAEAGGLPGRWVAAEPPRGPAGRGLVAIARWCTQ